MEHSKLRGRAPLPASVFSYFRELKAQYRVITPRPETNQAQELATQILTRAKEGGLTIDDVRALETALVSLQDPPRLLTWGTSLERRYAEVTGTPYQKPPGVLESNQELRAYVGQLLADLHRATVLADSSEEYRRRLILDSRVVIGQVCRNRLFSQTLHGGRDRCGIFEKSRLISSV